jgi:sorbitol-specific phosphotransferase system component IIBC
MLPKKHFVDEGVRPSVPVQDWTHTWHIILLICLVDRTAVVRVDWTVIDKWRAQTAWARLESSRISCGWTARVSTVENARMSTVDNARIGTVDNARIGTVDNARISTVDNARISTVDNAKITTGKTASLRDSWTARNTLRRRFNLLLQNDVAALAAKLHQMQDAEGLAAVVAGCPHLGLAALNPALLSCSLTVLKRKN